MERMSETPDTTLREARTWLSGNLREGAKCPCCKQLAKVYRRPLNSNQTRILIAAFRRFGVGRWFHGPEVADGSGDLAKLRYWGLVEEEIERRPDGGRTGWWIITELGGQFVRNETRVRSHALLYDGSLIRLEGQLVGPAQTLGKKFNYRALMDS